VSGGAGKGENRCEARGSSGSGDWQPSERRRRRDDTSRRPSSADARRKASHMAPSLITLSRAQEVESLGAAFGHIGWLCACPVVIDSALPAGNTMAVRTRRTATRVVLCVVT